TNWEGVGVTPDVAIPAVLALHRARATALQHPIAWTDDAAWKGRLKSALAEEERNTPRLKKVTISLMGYPDAREVSVAGTFNSWAPGRCSPRSPGQCLGR